MPLSLLFDRSKGERDFQLREVVDDLNGPILLLRPPIVAGCDLVAAVTGFDIAAEATGVSGAMGVTGSFIAAMSAITCSSFLLDRDLEVWRVILVYGLRDDSFMPLS